MRAQNFIDSSVDLYEVAVQASRLDKVSSAPLTFFVSIDSTLEIEQGVLESPPHFFANLAWQREFTGTC